MSKDFADTSQAVAHLDGCVFAALRADDGSMRGSLGAAVAGGPFTFITKDTRFICGEGSCGGVFHPGQHCGLLGFNKDRAGAQVAWEGTMCNTEYLFVNTTWEYTPSAGPASPWLTWTSSGSNPWIKVFTTLPGDDSLGGYRSIVSPLWQGMDSVDGCERIAS